MSLSSSSASAPTPLPRPRSNSTTGNDATARPLEAARRLAVPLVLVALAALVVLLAAENRRLERALLIASERSAGGLAIGDVLPAFDVQPLASTGGVFDPSVLAAGDLRNALLFFFTTTCTVCEQNHDAWARLAQENASSRIVLGIGLDDPSAVQRYVAEHELPFDIAAARDGYLAESLGLPGVPMTVAIDGAGVVEARELGVLPSGWSVDAATR
ncbi:MAG: TlpA disulfide reductase family protein [Acidobacteriota bacterium]